MGWIRVLLRDMSTALFYQGGVEWGDDPALAHDFGSSLAALDFCLQKRIPCGEIVLWSPERKLNIRLKPFARRDKD